MVQFEVNTGVQLLDSIVDPIKVFRDNFVKFWLRMNKKVLRVLVSITKLRGNRIDIVLSKEVITNFTVGGMIMI